MIYLDSGVIVRALLLEAPEHSRCIRIVGDDAVSSCHTFAEVFNTLTGFFKIGNDLASSMLEELADEMRFEEIARIDYLTIIRESRSRGIRGGIIYDAIHAEVARRMKVEAIYTFNHVNFRHVAPDLRVEIP